MKKIALLLIQKVATSMYFIIDQFGLFKFSFVENSFMRMYFLYKSYLENIDLSMVTRHIKPKSIVIDVGANLGWFAVTISQYLATGCSIFAVEPDKTNLHRLRLNIEKYKVGHLVKVFPFALSDEKGLGYLTLDRGNPANHQVGVTGEALEVVKLEVLDEIAKNVANVSLIKIDVQGHELKVLQGGIETLSKFKPTVIIEIDNRFEKDECKSIWDFMNSLGYKFYYIYDQKKHVSKDELCATKGYFDCICIHNSNIAEKYEFS